MRWGILGTGKIADKFVSELKQIPGVTLAGVASRTIENANKFAIKHDIEQTYKSYEELLNSPTINTVYISTPNFLHLEHCIDALKNKKAVLCEKPLAMSSDEGRQIVELARQQNTFCMEAMWMRFNPRVQLLKRWIVDKKIGKFSLMNAELGWKKEKDRVEKPELGRGAVLDFGVYPISLTHYLLGIPENIEVTVSRHTSGVDEEFSATFHYGVGKANIRSSVIKELANNASLNGSKGRVELDAPLLSPSGLTYISQGTQRSWHSKVHTRINRKFSSLRGAYSIGFRKEAEEVINCLSKGMTESPVMPLDSSIDVLRVVDRIRNLHS